MAEYGEDQGRNCCSRESAQACKWMFLLHSKGAYLFQMFDEICMLIRYMFLYKRCCFEQLLTRLTPELPLVLLLDMWLSGFGQLPGSMSAKRPVKSNCRRTHRNSSRCVRGDFPK